MKTLDRYLLQSFLVNYFLSLFVLISLYVVLDLFVNLDEFTESGKGILAFVAEVTDYYIYNLPLYFSQLSGVITSFAACATLARLQRQNEITAVQYSGTSNYRLAAPVIRRTRALIVHMISVSTNGPMPATTPSRMGSSVLAAA